MTTYSHSPRTATNRKESPLSHNERRNSQCRQVYARLLRGMQDEPCWLITVTKGRGLDLGLREHAWKMLRTRLGQEWPDLEFWTVYEYGTQRGVHLQAVVKGTPGLTAAWVHHVIGLLDDTTRVHVEQITAREDDRKRVAHYLTKQLVDGVIQGGWPKGFRVATTSRQWCPEWMRRAPWVARQRSRLGLSPASRSERLQRRYRVSADGRQAS